MPDFTDCSHQRFLQSSRRRSDSASSLELRTEFSGWLRRRSPGAWAVGRFGIASSLIEWSLWIAIWRRVLCSTIAESPVNEASLSVSGDQSSESYGTQLGVWTVIIEAHRSQLITSFEWATVRPLNVSSASNFAVDKVNRSNLHLYGGCAC